MPESLTIDADGVQAVASVLKVLQAELQHDLERLSYLSSRVHLAVPSLDMGASMPLQQPTVELHATIALLQEAQQGLLLVVKDTLRLEEDMSAGAAHSAGGAHPETGNLPEWLKQWLERSVLGLADLGLGLFGGEKWADQAQEGLNEKVQTTKAAIARLKSSLNQPGSISDFFRGWMVHLGEQIQAKTDTLKGLEQSAGHWETAGEFAAKFGKVVPFLGIPLDYVGTYGLTWNEKGAMATSTGGGFVLASDLLTAGVLPTASAVGVLVGSGGGWAQDQFAQRYGGPIGKQLEAPAHLLTEAGKSADITRVADDIGSVGADLYEGLPDQLFHDPMPSGFHRDSLHDDLLPDLARLANHAGALSNAPNQVLRGLGLTAIDDYLAGSDKLIQVAPFLPESYKQTGEAAVSQQLQVINGVAQWLTDYKEPFPNQGNKG